jgi:hypothetical protein
MTKGKRQMAKVKKQVRPNSKFSIAPLSPNTDKMEFMTSVYPIGFGYSEAGNVALFVHDHAVAEGEEGVVLEHLITARELERIIEAAQETLDNLGRHTIGVKLR